ncbi:MAG: hypothetical protein ACRELF_02210 [Gemmataceae bacterium]
MASKPPLPPSLSSPSTAWWDSPSASRSRSRGASGINWSVILASMSVSFALVVVVIAWIATHPNKAPKSPQAPIVAAIKVPAAPLPAPVPAAPRLVGTIETIPALHRPDRLETITNPLPFVDETPPPLPPPAPPEPRRGPEPAAVRLEPQPVGETYGTQVLFLNNQAAAADLARHDRKLLFVMHISGNFEDSCFT